MRCVLGLFEGVVTGAADGYYRMAERPAATLLHLGPGLANGLANLHNAKKARSGIVNIVGEHATYHLALRRAADLRHRGRGAADVGLGAHLGDIARRSPRTAPLAVQAARTPPGRIATLILPADTAWNEADGRARRPAARPPRAGVTRRRRSRPPPQRCAASAPALLLLLGGAACASRRWQLAGRIAARSRLHAAEPNSTARGCSAARAGADRSAFPTWSTVRWRC